MKLTGTLFGKKIYSYDYGIKCSESGIKFFLSKYKRIEILRKIAEFSARLFINGEKIILNKVPIIPDMLADLANYVIKDSDDSSIIKINDTDFSYAIRMCYSIFDEKLLQITKEPEEILMKIAYRQFIYQESSFNHFARAYYIYYYLWSELEISNGINIIKSIEEILGISYKQAIILTYAILRNQKGYFWPYEDEGLKQFNEKFGIDVTPKIQEKYLKFCSGTYQQILEEKRKLDPFLIYPLINTKTKPLKGKDDVYIIASHNHLHYKFTAGIYFMLIDKYNKGNKDNKFKEVFGFVFQEYVGRLLTCNFSKWEIIPEIKYKIKKSKSQDTIDWFVKNEEKLILIEVKQSTIFLDAKDSADLGKIKKDLKNTLVKAVIQLKRTYEDIKSMNYMELTKFNNSKNFQFLIVVNDPLYNANLIGKSLINKEFTNLCFDYHIINIEEFEVILSNQKDTETLFDLLENKSLNYKEYDFKEFLLEMYPKGNKNNILLEKYYNEFFSSST